MVFLNKRCNRKADCYSYTQRNEAVLYFYVDEVPLVDVRLVPEVAQDEQELEAETKDPSEAVKVLINVQRDIEGSVLGLKGNQPCLVLKLGQGQRAYYHHNHLDCKKNAVETSNQLENFLGLVVTAFVLDPCYVQFGHYKLLVQGLRKLIDHGVCIKSARLSVRVRFQLRAFNPATHPRGRNFNVRAVALITIRKIALRSFFYEIKLLIIHF